MLEALNSRATRGLLCSCYASCYAIMVLLWTHEFDFKNAKLKGARVYGLDFELCVLFSENGQSN